MMNLSAVIGMYEIELSFYLFLNNNNNKIIQSKAPKVYVYMFSLLQDTQIFTVKTMPF